MDCHQAVPDLAGMPLHEALAILSELNITPQVVYAMPDRMKEDMDKRTARVVRYCGNTLLCSYFRDLGPEKT